METTLEHHALYDDLFQDLRFVVSLNPSEGLLSGKLVCCNEKAAGFTGYTMSEMIEMGTHFLTSMIHPDDLAKCSQAAEHLLKGSTLRYCNSFRVRQKNRTGYVRLHGNCVMQQPNPTDDSLTFINTLLIDDDPDDKHTNADAKNKETATTAEGLNLETVLTTREYHIARHIMAGKTTKAIANLLFISVKTVKTHRASINKKLNTHSPAQLIKVLLTHNVK